MLEILCLLYTEKNTMDIYFILIATVSMLASLMAVRWIFFKILKIAKEKNLVDNPDARKLQKTPVPLVGGIVVFFGVIFGLLLGVSAFFLCSQCFGPCEVHLSLARLLPVALAMAVMLYAGAIDDILGLSPMARFAIEILVVTGMALASGVCIDSLHGLWGIAHFTWWLALPLTVFAGVGVINSINMVDGVNGLSSGLCVLCCLLFGVVFMTMGDYANSVLAFSMMASLLPFIVHNVFGNTSRMYIGDAGTMVMGVLMIWFVMCTMHDAGQTPSLLQGYCPTAMVVAFLSVPVADTLRVMTMRILRGKSPFSPDRTHLHHAFVDMGMSHSVTSLSEICINFAVVAIWFVSARLGASSQAQLYIVVLVAAVLVWGTYFVLGHERPSNGRIARWLRHFSPKTHFGKTEWWQRISFFLDSPEYDEHERRNLRERLDRKFGYRRPSR